MIDKEYLLQKFPGKGGWTYALIPEISQNKKAPFGWVTVSGSIDDYILDKYKLMPMGDGESLFLPVKAAIRKKIKKEAGDRVHVVIYLDNTPLEIPQEIRECFASEPKAAYENFLGFTESEQKAYLDWIYAAKKEETQAERIVKMMDRSLRKLKWHDKDP